MNDGASVLGKEQSQRGRFYVPWLRPLNRTKVSEGPSEAPRVSFLRTRSASWSCGLWPARSKSPGPVFPLRGVVSGVGDTPGSGGPVTPRRGLSLEALCACGPLWAASSPLVTKEQILWDSTCTIPREVTFRETDRGTDALEAGGGEAGASSWRWTGMWV